MGIPLVADMGGKKSSASNSSLPFSVCKIGNVFYTMQTMGTWLNEIVYCTCAHSIMVTRLDPFHLKAHGLLELLSIKWQEGLRLSVCVCVTLQECEFGALVLYGDKNIFSSRYWKKVLNVDPLIRVFLYWLCLLEL